MNDLDVVEARILIVRRFYPQAHLHSDGYMYWIKDPVEGRILGDKKASAYRAWASAASFVHMGGAIPTQVPSAIDALQAIANLPTGSNIDIMQGHEDAYRAVEDLFEYPPTITSSK